MKMLLLCCLSVRHSRHRRQLPYIIHLSPALLAFSYFSHHPHYLSFATSKLIPTLRLCRSTSPFNRLLLRQIRLDIYPRRLRTRLSALTSTGDRIRPLSHRPRHTSPALTLSPTTNDFIVDLLARRIHQPRSSLIPRSKAHFSLQSLHLLLIQQIPLLISILYLLLRNSALLQDLLRQPRRNKHILLRILRDRRRRTLQRSPVAPSRGRRPARRRVGDRERVVRVRVEESVAVPVPALEQFDAVAVGFGPGVAVGEGRVEGEDDDGGGEEENGARAADEGFVFEGEVAGEDDAGGGEVEGLSDGEDGEVEGGEVVVEEQLAVLRVSVLLSPALVGFW